MCKGQAIQRVFRHLLWLGLSLVLIYFLTACSADHTTSPTLTPTHTSIPTTPSILTSKTALIPIPSETPSPTATAITVTPTIDCLNTGGSLHQVAVYSEILQEDLQAQIYLPPCYAPTSGNAYPVIILLHGLLSSNDQWIHLGLVDTMDGLIARGEISPAIVVLPQEPRTPTGQTSEYDNALVSDLLPWVDANYATHPDRAFRAIGGISRGAAWAVQIGFENLPTFSRIGAHSLPLLNADVLKIAGWLIQTPKDIAPELFIDIGRDDPEWQSARNFADQLDEYQIPHEWYFYTGGHTESYWASHLEQYIRWYTRDW